jgi:NADPH:quinone reductase-like Zn-dependent oxidoreductase
MRGQCRLEPCAAYAAECGDLYVPEDRSQPDGRIVCLHVAMFRRYNPDPEPDPVIYLTGGGGVDTFAVQMGKAFGAEVTGVCSTRNLDLVRSIGASHVIDYTRADFTQGGQRFDLIFDAVAKRSFRECKRVPVPGGIYVTTAFTLALALDSLWVSLTGDQKLVPLSPKPPGQTNRASVTELLEAGKVRPVIDRQYPLSEVPEALRYLAKGHARGKVVIAV